MTGRGEEGSMCSSWLGCENPTLGPPLISPVAVQRTVLEGSDVPRTGSAPPHAY